MAKTYKHIKNKYISTRETERRNFLQNAKNKYGKTYNYNNINYVNARTPITIHCNKHNLDFQQAPLNHLKSNGCPKCFSEAMSLNTETFIKRANDVHGRKYDYSKTVYHRSSAPVTITCPIHGDFTNIASNHLKGAGCHRCKNQIHIHTQRQPDEKILTRFVNKARKLYGDRFDYSKVNIRESKPLFYCNKHQVEFRQERRNHLRYFGCKVCAAEKHSLSQEEFIKRSKVVYGDRFDYSLVKFKNTYTKVTIICKEHGPIEVIPYDHMRGKASCSKCTASSFEKSVYSLLETLKIPYIREYKIEGFDYRYDVLIPDVKLLIEIHGPQHYEAVTFYNGTLYEDRAARDKDKATIAKSNNFAIAYINCIKYGNNVKKELLPILRSYLKYYKDGRYYKSFADFAVYNKLPNDARPKDYQSYKTTF